MQIRRILISDIGVKLMSSKKYRCGQMRSLPCCSYMLPARDILSQTEKDLEQFDRILLIKDTCEMPFPAAMDVKNILILSSGEIPLDSNRRIAYRKITAEQQAELLRIYHMYEFSDRFRVVSWDSRFGSIWNYVDAGILTEQEALEALVR